jgi:hypothetical protein
MEATKSGTIQVMTVKAIVARSKNSVTFEVSDGIFLMLEVEQGIKVKGKGKGKGTPKTVVVEATPVVTPLLGNQYQPFPPEASDEPMRRAWFPRRLPTEDEWTTLVEMKDCIGKCTYTSRKGKTRQYAIWREEGDKYRLLWPSKCGEFAGAKGNGFAVAKSLVTME